MTDYRLDSLSSRSFEHIIQALAIGAITPTATPFGDGPDGGREATFEGMTQYGPETDRWNGYGIIQAKYRTRSQGTTDDARWACTELKKELRQYTREENPRPVPRYYIFAVNVVLSPGEGAGKDQIRGILNEFSKGREFEFDIWDYDKLRVLIDRDEAVRRAYMAWITPSDVLAKLCDYLGARQRDYYKIILRYLQREFVADQYARLEQAGHSADESIPLSQVFIDLPTSLNPSAPDAPRRHDSDETMRFVSRVVEESGLSLREEGKGHLSAKGDAPSSEPLKRRTGRSVLIGGPGQGKTTIAQYVCQVFRCAILNDVDKSYLDSDVQTTLHEFMNRWTAEGNSLPSARRLPFRIVLSEFAKKLAAGETQSLMGYLASRLCSNTDISISAEEVERIISEYPTIVILDGLDEVPSSTNRDDVIRAVTNFSIDVATGDIDTYIVATTRPQGYNEEFSPRQYIHHYLLPLTPDDALVYANKLAKIRFGSNQDRFKKVTGRLRRAVEKPATARLMQTPLQVTILTLLVDRMGDPPEERWSLFREYYQLIYDRETERDIVSVRVLKEHHRDVDAIHRRVGIALQVESERSGGTDARLTLDQFGHIVEDYLLEEKYAGSELHDLKTKIIDAAANRLVFLVGLEAGLVGFEIRSLQEFMASEGITDGDDETIRSRLRAIASSSHWRNVFLFAAGKCFSDRTYLRDTIQSICAELNDDESDESLRILLVGSVLALDLLEDGPARRTPLTRGTLTRMALQLLGTPFRDVARIAGVCEESTRSIFYEELRLKLNGEPSFSSEQAWACLTVLVDRYGREFEQLARELIEKRPLSNTEFDRAVEISSGRNNWLTRALFQVVDDRAARLPSGFAPDEDSDNSDKRHIGPWSRSDYPTWLEWWADQCGSSFAFTAASTYQLLGSNGKSHAEFMVNRLKDASYRFYVPPADLPATERWEAQRQIGNFCETPNAANLAAAVQAVRATDNSSSKNSLASSAIGLDRFLGFRAPWPLVEVLFADASSPDFPLAETIESGAYGNIDKWLNFDEKLSEGITLREIINLPMLAPTADGGLFEFPFRAARMISGIFSATRERSVSDLSELVDAFDQTDNMTIRYFLSDLILRAASKLPKIAVTAAPDWVDRICYWLCSSTQYPNASFYNFIDGINLYDPKWSQLFAAMRPNLLTGRNFARPHAVSKLRDIITEDGNYRGLLVPYAHCLLSTTGLSAYLDLPRDRSFAIEGSPSECAAAVIVNILMGDKISELVDGIIGFAAEDNEIIATNFITAVLARGRPYQQERQELLDLVKILHPDRTVSWDFFGRNFERRPSMLLAAGEWDRLNLPSTMRRVLALES